MAAVGCSASSTGHEPPLASLESAAGGRGAAGPHASGSGGSPVLIDTGGSTGTGISSETPELCNGIDDDGNGVVDDLDAAGDGICDCLRIATLGIPGVHGSGDVFAAWISERSANGATDIADGVLTPDLLDEFQVVVAQDLSTLDAYTNAEAVALADWVSRGGGFMTLIGYSGPTEVENVNRLLSRIGVGYEPTQIMQKNSDQTRTVTGFAAHPVTTNVTALGMDNGYPVQGAGTVLVTGDGWDLALALDFFNGHVLMWGDEWISYDSEWTTRPDLHVEQFWLNALKWLTPSKECQVPVPIIQ